MSAGSVLGRIGSFLVVVLVVLLFGWWGWYRYMMLTGGPSVDGVACTAMVSCRGQLCLVHARSAPGAPLSAVDGYCTSRCKGDGDCGPAMRCEPLPDGVSRAAGDHLPYLKLPERLCVRVGAAPPKR